MASRSLIVAIVGAIAAAAICPLVAAAQSPAPPTTTLSLLTQQYGLVSAPLIRTTTETVGTSPTQIVNSDPARVELVVVNNSSGPCEIDRSPQVSSTQGVVLAASGGSLTLDFRADLTWPTYAEYAVCSAASSPVTVYEVALQ
jgi:hypothetical protein